MTYCDGMDLDKLIKNSKNRNKHFKEPSVMNYFVQMLLGLDHIHSQNIIHRDIKPQNMFLLGNGRLVIGDLGVSKMLENTLSANSFTGTPYFIAPELCNEKKYNNKVDIWSLGCLLYYMVTFHYPFQATNYGELFIKISSGKYPPITNYTKEYSKDMEELISELITVNPSRRPSTSILLSKHFIKKHLVNVFHDLLTIPKNKMGEETINIKNAFRYQAKEKGSIVSTDVIMDIPNIYKIYIQQLDKIGALNDIINSVWKEKNSNDKIEVNQQILEIKRQKKYIIEESLKIIKKEKKDREKRYNDLLSIKNKKQENFLKLTSLDTDLIDQPEKCFTPSALLDSGFSDYDNKLISVDDDNDKNDVDVDDNDYSKEDGWASSRSEDIDCGDELDEKEEDLKYELYFTNKNITELEQSNIQQNKLEEEKNTTCKSPREMNKLCINQKYENRRILISKQTMNVIPEDDESSSDEDGSDCDDYIKNNKVRSLNMKCEMMKNKIIKDIGPYKYNGLYSYIKSLSKISDNSQPDFSHTTTMQVLKSFFDILDEKYILQYSKSIFDIIFIENNLN